MRWSEDLGASRGRSIDARRTCWQIMASLFFRTLAILPGAAAIAWVIVASAGAVLVIRAQRMFWHPHA